MRQPNVNHAEQNTAAAAQRDKTGKSLTTKLTVAFADAITPGNPAPGWVPQTRAMHLVQMCRLAACGGQFKALDLPKS